MNTSRPRHVGMIFGPESIRAALGGRKTQTRRLRGLEIVNESPDKWSLLDHDSMAWSYDSRRGPVFGPLTGYRFVPDDGVPVVCRPRARAGDLIWAKEEYGYNALKGIVYAADFPGGKFPAHIAEWSDAARHMPKVRARVWWRLLDVRPVRLWDISEEDAIEEGVSRCRAHCPDRGFYRWEGHPWRPTAVDAFRDGWDDIDAPKHAWAKANWHVWRYLLQKLPQIDDLHRAGIDITHGQDSVEYVRGVRERQESVIEPAERPEGA